MAFAERHLARHLRQDARLRLQWHLRQGHHVVIVSASPECYVRPAGELLGVELVLQVAHQLRLGERRRLCKRLAFAQLVVERKRGSGHMRQRVGERGTVCTGLGLAAQERRVLGERDRPCIGDHGPEHCVGATDRVEDRGPELEQRFERQCGRGLRHR